MDILEELKNYKRNLGFSNEEISKGSGIPLGTVQKIFGGVTTSPRRKTLLALERFFRRSFAYGSDPDTPDAAGASELSDVSSPYHIDDDMAAGDEKDPGWIIKNNTKDDPFNEKGRLIFTRQGTYTLDDFYALPEGVRAELIDGVFYEFNAPTLVHQTIVLEIATRLKICAQEKDCMVFVSPVNVRLDKDDRTMIEPDIAATCNKSKAEFMNCVNGAPEFVLEVLSDSTRKRDLTIKTAKYEHAGCREYWIVDPKNEDILVYYFEDANVIYHYTFNDKVPVRMSGGECVIDFSEIKKSLTWFNR